MTAPWGESHVPLHRPLIRSGRAVVYSPYSAPPGSSVDFLAWQMSRAVTAIYGSSESWESIRNRYLVVRDDGATGLAVPGFSYRSDHPGLPAPKAGGTFPLILFLVVVPYFFLIALYLRLQRTDHSDRGRLTIYWSIAGFLLLLWIMPFIATLAGWLWPGAAGGGLIAMATNRLAGSAGLIAAAWVGALSFTALGYATAERQFLSMEVPARPPRLTLIDWAGERT